MESQPGEFIETTAGRIVDVLRADPDRIVVQGLFRGGASETSDVVLARVNVKNRGISTVYTYHASDRTGDIVVDRAGALRLRSRQTAQGELIWAHRANDDQPWREIARHPFDGYAETWRPLSFAADPRTLWLVSREEHDRGALYADNTRTCERGPAVFVRAFPRRGSVPRGEYERARGATKDGARSSGEVTTPRDLTEVR